MQVLSWPDICDRQWHTTRVMQQSVKESKTNLRAFWKEGMCDFVKILDGSLTTAAVLVQMVKLCHLLL